MLRTIACAFLALNSVCAWKPLASPTSFSISQQHPALGSSHNGIAETAGNYGGDSSPHHQSHSSSSITYHGNSFLNDHADGHHDVGSDDELLGHTEPRILHKETAAADDGSFYGNSFYNSLHPSAVSFD